MGRAKPIASLTSANEKGRLSFAARPELSLKSGSTKWPPDPKLAAISSDHRGQRSLAAANGELYSVERHLLHDPRASVSFAEAHVRRLEAVRRGAGGGRTAPGSSPTIILPGPRPMRRAWRGTGRCGWSCCRHCRWSGSPGPKARPGWIGSLCRRRRRRCGRRLRARSEGRAGSGSSCRIVLSVHRIAESNRRQIPSWGHFWGNELVSIPKQSAVGRA